MTTVGLISDTHGRLPHGVFRLFEGVDRILHAGDVGPPELLVELGAIAPVTAVHGNTDGSELRTALPSEALVELGTRTLVLLHGDALPDQRAVTFRAARPDADLIVHGHTHRARVDRSASPWVVNPGSAGAPRRGTPPSVAILRVDESGLEVEVLRL
jgi:putative phosphoesterase